MDAAEEQAFALDARIDPNAMFVTGEDNLRLTVFNALASVVVTVRGRLLGLDGVPRPFEDRVTPNTSRTASTVTVRLPEGWLLNATAFVTTASPLSGQCFAVLSLVRGEGTAAIELATLAAGDITASQRVAWPGGAIRNSLDGGGAIRSITGSVPAAGAEISETVPTGARWELIAFNAAFTTSATVANRLPFVTLDDGALAFYKSSTGTNLPAGFTYQLSYGEGTPTQAGANNNIATGTLPVGIRLPAGARIRTTTQLIQVGDQYGAPQMLVREWIEGA